MANLVKRYKKLLDKPKLGQRIYVSSTNNVWTITGTTDYGLIYIQRRDKFGVGYWGIPSSSIYSNTDKSLRTKWRSDYDRR